MTVEPLPFLPFLPPAWWTAWTAQALGDQFDDVAARYRASECPPPPPADPDWWKQPDQLGPPDGWVAS